MGPLGDDDFLCFCLLFFRLLAPFGNSISTCLTFACLQCFLSSDDLYVVDGVSGKGYQYSISFFVRTYRCVSLRFRR